MEMKRRKWVYCDKIKYFEGLNFYDWFSPERLTESVSRRVIGMARTSFRAFARAIFYSQYQVAALWQRYPDLLNICFELYHHTLHVLPRLLELKSLLQAPIDLLFTSSFPYFLPSPFLTCCAILPTSFGGKGPHLRRWLVAQSLHQTVS